MKKRLPSIIFAENHYDETTASVLLKLLPKLKSMGYDCFFDEEPESWTLKIKIKFIEDQLCTYATLAKQFKDHGLSIDSENDVMKYVLLRFPNEKKGLPNTNLMVTEATNAVLNIIHRHKSRLIYKKFYESLEVNSIAYRGTDIESALYETKKSLITGKNTSDLETLIAAAIPRDKNMATVYLNSCYSVFGSIGLFHAEGIQKEIITQITQEMALEQYCFFNIYSDPPSTASNNLETKIRNGSLRLPLGITCIDARSKNVDQVVDIVLRTLIEKFPYLANSYSTNYSTSVPVESNGIAPASTGDEKITLLQMQLKSALQTDDQTLIDQIFAQLCDQSTPVIQNVRGDFHTLCQMAKQIRLLNNELRTQKEINVALCSEISTHNQRDETSVRTHVQQQKNKAYLAPTTNIAVSKPTNNNNKDYMPGIKGGFFK